MAYSLYFGLICDFAAVRPVKAGPDCISFSFLIIANLAESQEGRVVPNTVLSVTKPIGGSVCLIQ